MLIELSLTATPQRLSQFIIKYFSIENESVLRSHSFENIHHFQEVLAIIGDKQMFKTGTLQWGRTKNPQLLTLSKKAIDQSLVLKNHYQSHRCLILTNGFYTLNPQTNDRYYFNEINEKFLLLAGIFYTTMDAQIKKHHVAIMSTSSPDQYALGGPILPVVLNQDQWHFWLNPKTIVSELNYLFLPDNFKDLKIQPVFLE